MYNPDHLLLCVVIHSVLVVIGPVMTQTDSNQYQFWDIIKYISTPEISIVVVIDQLQPRLIKL